MQNANTECRKLKRICAQSTKHKEETVSRQHENNQLFSTCKCEKPLAARTPDSGVNLGLVFLQPVASRGPGQSLHTPESVQTPEKVYRMYAVLRMRHEAWGASNYACNHRHAAPAAGSGCSSTVPGPASGQTTC